MSEVKLIFIISQPRSGSTMLQHILAAHSRVATLPEPWFLLPLLYKRKQTMRRADYRDDYAWIALDGFLKRIPEGESVYRLAIQEFAYSLYSSALETKPGSDYFLDKTPRYYFIIKELKDIFPDSKILLLVRNPLAVLSSIINYNFDGDWWRMLCEGDRRHDLLTAPRLITDVIQDDSIDCEVVKYEQLVAYPFQQIRRICAALQLDFDPGMVEYGSKTRFENTTFVDTKSVYVHDQPVTKYAEAWRKSFDTVEKAHLALSYLDLLGEEVLSVYGEKKEQLVHAILREQPKALNKQRSQKAKAISIALQRGPAVLKFTEKLSIRWKPGLQKRFRKFMLN